MWWWGDIPPIVKIRWPFGLGGPKTVPIPISHRGSWRDARDVYAPWCALFDVSTSTGRWWFCISIYRENMSFVFLLLFLLTLPEPVWWFKGLNPRAAKRFFWVAGEGETVLRRITRLFFGVRFLFLGFMTPLATTEMPVLNACRPACLRRGVARRMMFFITPPRPYPLW